MVESKETLKISYNVINVFEKIIIIYEPKFKRTGCDSESRQGLDLGRDHCENSDANIETITMDLCNVKL